jgi:hypothetical protein
VSNLLIGLLFIFMAKEGFKGQWIEICKVGEFVDANGTQVKVDDAFLAEALATFDPTNHEPPIVIGHPAMEAPAYGWVSEVKLADGKLLATVADTNDDFEKLVESGAFKKRSSAFYTQPEVSLRHVGFLGAAPPAVKGLKNIQFAEGDQVAFEETIIFEEQPMIDKNKKDEESFMERFKKLFSESTVEGGAAPAADPNDGKTVTFSEADAMALIEKAAAAIEAKFSEQLKQKDAAIEELRKSVNGQVGASRHAEIVAFVESIPAEQGRHFLKEVGAVAFLESLAIADAADASKAVVCFSEGEDGKQVTHEFSRLEWAKILFSGLPKMIEFGEKFGSVTATKDAGEMLNTERVKAMKDEMGLKEKEGGK